MTRSMMLLALLLVGACSSSADDGDKAGEEASAPTIEMVLDRSSEAMSKVESARFTVEQTGAEVFIDGDGLIRFVGAKGRFAAPASSDAVVKVNALGLTTEVGAVAIDGQIWITNPLTGDWEVAPESFSFDPTVLFDPDRGWSSLLADGLQDPVLLSADDVDRHHMQSTVAADRVRTLTGGLVDEPSLLDLWIDVDTGLVVEAAFDVEIGAGSTSWLLTITDYGADVTITEPELAPSG